MIKFDHIFYVLTMIQKFNKCGYESNRGMRTLYK